MNTFVNLFIELANASSAAHGAGHEEGIPTIVLYQAINVSIFIGILYWFGKDKVREVFSARLTEFHRLAQETEQARKNLEFKKSDLVRRTEQLKTTSAQSLRDAQTEAEKVYLSEIEKSRAQVVKISKDADAQITTEQQKIIEKLRQEALEMSVTSVEKELSQLHSDSQAQRGHTQNSIKRIEGASV